MPRIERVSAFLTAVIVSMALCRPAAATKLEVLHEFTGPDGCDPTGGVIVDNNTGALYGTATFCGSGNGTAFSLTPPETGKHKWKFETIYMFQGGFDGSRPSSGLTMSISDLFFWGVTETGSSLCDCGTLFELENPLRPHAKWKKTTLHEFSGDTDDGTIPNSAPYFTGVYLYGTTGAFGTTGDLSPPGTVYRFKIHSGEFTVLYNPPQKVGGDFFGAPPQGVVYDFNSKTVYGTGVGDTGDPIGAKLYGGTVFQLTGAGGTVVHPFGGNGVADGANPLTGPTIDLAGNLYGTTSTGGDPAACPNSPGCGIVWELSANGVYKVLHSFAFFTNPRDGQQPMSPLVVDEDTGTLYGTTLYGGTGTQCGGDGGSCGTVFQIDESGNYKVLWEFPKGGPAAPRGQLAVFNGELYGTSYDGGQPCPGQHYIGCGTVWKLTP